MAANRRSWKKGRVNGIGDACGCEGCGGYIWTEVLSNRQARLNVPAPTATLYYRLYPKPGSCPSSHRAFDSLSAFRLYNAAPFTFEYPFPRHGRVPAD